MERDEYPSNTRSNREPLEVEDKKIESVVTTKVVQRKKTLGKRFKETFIGGDARDAAEYVVLKLLMPAAKEAITDAVTQWIERMIFPDGSRGSGYRSTPRSNSNGGGYVNYSRYSSSSSSSRREEPREDRSRSTSPRSMNDIIMATRPEALTVLKRMQDLAAKYGVISVAEFYSLVDVTGDWNTNAFGWNEYDLADVIVRRHSQGGYILDLPKPEPLK
jgi:hypothetical protein